MKILVILPNWLGDAVMATPAIESIVTCKSDVKFTFVGSYVSIEALKHHPNCKNAYVDETKKGGNRFLNTYRFAKKLQGHDMAISFRNQLHSSLLLKWSGTPVTIARESWHSRIFLSDAVKLLRDEHLVLQYQKLADKLCNQKIEPQTLKLYIQKHLYKKPTLGINPGATYGSAKRWYPEKFAKVAKHFADKYDIVIFGGPNEREMANEIESVLKELHVSNVTNLAGETTIEQLCAYIGGLSLFVTNDSGPMHVAAAYQVPTVSIFGPTRHHETSQWKNQKSKIVRHDMDCAPCMKRECPLKHHECMRSIEADEVIKVLNYLI